jgi:hypothetical protein
MWCKPWEMWLLADRIWFDVPATAVVIDSELRSKI